MRKPRLLHQRAAILVLVVLVASSMSPSSYFPHTKLTTSYLPGFQVTDISQNGSKTNIDEDARMSLEGWSTPASDIFSEPYEGVLKPVTIEQSGYTSTGDVAARTDTSINTQQYLAIDTSHNWVASQAEINVSNLERLYVINGTFDEGYPGYTVSPNGTLMYYPFGWSANSTNSDVTLEQTQEVSYEMSTEQYVTAQNKARLTNPGQKQYTHYANTSVLWNQSFENLPYTTQFLLSFSYLLLQGPLSSGLSGNYSLKAFIDKIPVASINLPVLAQRGSWFETGVVPVSIAIPAGTTSFMIGLVIDDTFTVSANTDYDGDGIADGIANTQYIKICIDNVLLIGAAPPNCENVDLHFSVNGISAPIFGDSGTGTGFMVNESYWTLSPLTISLSSNTSVSLVYNVRLLNHRFMNSSSTTSTLEIGVSYSIDYNRSGSLELFTYLGILGLYDNLTIQIYHPVDWQNFTILDPFLSDVTSSCNLDSDRLTIPTYLLDRLGWWKILCDSYNYAHSVVIERYDAGTMNWIGENVFHSDDLARASIQIGSGSHVPVLSNPVNFTWILPNSTLWQQSSIVSGLVGSASSSLVSFGPTNTTAGSWNLVYKWTNGSELAYGAVRFDLNHQAALEIVFADNLDTVVGQPVTIVLRFYDIENGLFILNEGVELIGTWAAGVVDFEPNIVKNWWQADFDTALVGAGDFDVSITSAAPYFETTPYIVTIKSQFLTSLESPTGPLQPLIYGRQYNFDYFYSIDYNKTGVDNALVELSGAGSQWAAISEEGNGNYTLSLTPLGLRDYSIFVSFSKEGYQNQTHVLSFLVNKVPMEVNPVTSLVGPESQPLLITVNVTEVDTGNAVSNANVNLSILASGITYADVEMDETAPGIYSTSIIMPSSGETTYNVVIVVEKENYEVEQETRFALIPTFDANARLLTTIMSYSGEILTFAGVIVAAVVGQKFYSRRRRRMHSLARDIKIRFDDASNLLGVVVLHKLSGVPIYSKILKGGFEEGMLSAFITAIMHFRAEFDKQREQDDYIVIPVSDIVRTVPTKNLICAFITMTSASKPQEQRMINYARAIGMMFDETLAERPSQVVDAKTIKTFEWMFDDFVDGVLLRPYRVGKEKLPKRLRCVEDVVDSADGVESFFLINLVRLLETCGVDEDAAYVLVMDAIEQEIIVPVYPNNGFEMDSTEG